MRITKSLLQRIIREERARLHEGFDAHAYFRAISQHAGGAAMATAIDELREEWMKMGDADPDMAMRPGGLAGWERQVDAALGSLTEQISNAVSEVEEGLINGDYAPRRRV